MRAGDFDGLVAVLDPDLVVHADQAAVLPGQPGEVRGADFWARQAITSARGARAARAALINGEVGVMIAPRGKLFRVLRFTIANGRIKQVDVIGDPVQLAKLELALLEP